MIVIEPDENLGDAWPLCPQCQQRRQTVCPVCSVAGEDFPFADALPAAAPLESIAADESEQQASDAEGSDGEASDAEASDGEGSEMEVLLMCPTCDEAFAPHYYRMCQQCGHDFGEGIEVDQTAGDDVNRRVVFVFVAIVLLVLALSAFFAFVLR